MKMWNKIIMHMFRIMVRIDIHFEVRKSVHKNLIIFDKYNMKLLYTVM
jgi:hypothetical protein